MKHRIFLLVILLLCSCKSLPTIQPLHKSSSKHDQNICSSPFPDGSWQFIHSIEATMPDRKKTFVMGITNISSDTKKIDVVMMTIEGMVLLDATYDSKLIINKSIRPFDSKDFASGLINDIKLIFFQPQDRLMQEGYLKDGQRICRYKKNEGIVVDIQLCSDKTWEIKKYNIYNRLTRKVKIYSISETQNRHETILPQKIELFAYGANEYSFVLNLIKANQLE